MNLFNPVSKEGQHFLLASHLPPGKMWKNAFNREDTFGKLFYSLAIEFYRFQNLEKNFVDEFNIEKTEEWISDWEEFVGIPNSCFNTNKSLEVRRKQVIQMFSKFGGVQTKEDFIRVAAYFDITITIRTGREVGTFPLLFPIVFFSSTKAAEHSFFVEIVSVSDTTNTFPLPFPIKFSKGDVGFLQCIFNQLAPANVNVIIVTSGDLTQT